MASRTSSPTMSAAPSSPASASTPTIVRTFENQVGLPGILTCADLVHRGCFRLGAGRPSCCQPIVSPGVLRMAARHSRKTRSHCLRIALGQATGRSRSLQTQTARAGATTKTSGLLHLPSGPRKRACSISFADGEQQRRHCDSMTARSPGAGFVLPCRRDSLIDQSRFWKCTCGAPKRGCEQRSNQLLHLQPLPRGHATTASGRQ